MKNPLFIAGSSVFALVLIGGAWSYWGSGAYARSQTASAVVPAPTATSSAISGHLIDPTEIADPAPPPEGYVEYSNDRYGFKFYHAPEAQIKEYDEGGGAMTITLENYARVRGLQIFIVPYGEPKISEERFHKDVPSGVRTNVEATTIGEAKVEAVTFLSKDMLLGDTREIWFLHNGYLFEITTFKGVGNWLAPIIQSWRFI